MIPVSVKVDEKDWPKETDLPKECKAMLVHQLVAIGSGAGFIDSINHLLKSMDRMLKGHTVRREEADALDDVSPSSGLALGYYVNFLKPVLQSLTAVDPEKSRGVFEHH